MLDRIGKEAFLVLIPIPVGVLLGGPTGAAICLALMAMIALVLWTPLRGWLGIPPHLTESRGRVGYRGRPGSTATFRRTRFGETLDTDIDNEGDIDVDDSDVD
jgi:hypothetical protein